MLSRWGATVVVSVTLALVFVGAAFAENYQYRRTSNDDAKARSAVVVASDFPPSLHVKGGPTKPDETPSTAKDACAGVLPKQSDLVVTGDAESAYHDAAGLLRVDTQVTLFRTAAMAESDWKRNVPQLTLACLREAAAKDTDKTKTTWVSFKRLGALHVDGQSLQLLSEVAYKDPGKPAVRFVVVVTGIRRGRVEGMVLSMLPRMGADTPGVVREINTRFAQIVASRLPST
jgi:hypothetical protein